MKAYNRIFLAVIAAMIILFSVANAVLLTDKCDSGRPYLVEVSRLVHKIESNAEIPDVANCKYVTAIAEYDDKFYYSDSDYVIRNIGGKLYRFDYRTVKNTKTKLIVMVNIILGVMSAVIIGVMLYIRHKILCPFEKLTNIPYELSKGNLTAPVRETKNRFFGRFIWGIDMLRENMEHQKENELNLQRDKKMLLLSLSHDIKTPLSAIKLYSKALSKGLYANKEKQIEIAESINAKADEIESYVCQIITASREEFLSLNVQNGEFYLSELVVKTKSYYAQKLELIRTEFCMGDYSDCLINGDFDRSIEVIQNIIENAVKYGDGKSISVDFTEEDGCILITISDSGCTLEDTDLPHIFESFWRGANAEKEKGSGLGLYICRQLMHKMNGEIFAEIKSETMYVTAVFVKA